MPVIYKEIPEELIAKRTTWGSNRDNWLNKVTLEEEYYYNDVDNTGTNFTQKQLDVIMTEGSGVPVSINHIYPAVNQKLAILTQTKPTFKVVALDGRSKQYANILDKAVKSIMYRSEAVGEEEETIKNMMVLGMGISSISETDYHQFGTFGIQYENIHPSMVILDSNSKKRSLNDMEGYFIEKEITLSEAEVRYGDIIAKLNEKRALEGDNPLEIKDFISSTYFGAVGQGKIEETDLYSKIVVSEYYDKVFSTMYFVEDIETGNILRLFKENLEEDQDFILEGAKDKENNRFIRRTIMLGNYIVAVEIKPIKDFQIKVKFFEWGGRPYRSYGMVHFTKSMQETFDKAIQTMIVNGMLTNNAGYIGPKGSIAPQDVPKWEMQGNRPGIFKEYTLQLDGSGHVVKPEREQIQQLSNFYPTILQMMEMGIQKSTGINAVVTGDASEANVDVFSSLQQYQNSAMQRIQLAMSHINLANQQLGNVMIDMLINNLDIGQNYIFFDEKDVVNELQILKESASDFKLGRYGVLSIASEAMPTQRMAMSTELMKISQTTADPNERNIYVQKAFELADMRGFDDVQEKVDGVKKLQSQLNQMQEQLDRDAELMKLYENRAINAEYNAKLAAKLACIESSIDQAEIETKKDIVIEKLQEQIKELKNPKKVLDK